MSNPDRTDDVDPLMSIGMFSRSSLVSVKALRSYHEQGLLVPDVVDPATGYRSYEQLRTQICWPIESTNP